MIISAILFVFLLGFGCGWKVRDKYSLEYTQDWAEADISREIDGSYATEHAILKRKTEMVP